MPRKQQPEPEPEPVADSPESGDARQQTLGSQGAGATSAGMSGEQQRMMEGRMEVRTEKRCLVEARAPALAPLTPCPPHDCLMAPLRTSLHCRASGTTSATCTSSSSGSSMTTRLAGRRPPSPEAAPTASPPPPPPIHHLSLPDAEASTPPLLRSQQDGDGRGLPLHHQAAGRPGRGGYAAPAAAAAVRAAAARPLVLRAAFITRSAPCGICTRSLTAAVKGSR